MSNYNTTILKGDPKRVEGVGSEALYPGHLIEYGGSNDLQKHSTAGGDASKMFALENEMVGNTPTDGYSSGDRVYAAVFSSGQEVQARVAASAAAISKGDALMSAGDGTLKLHSKQAVDYSKNTSTLELEDNRIVAYAMEALDNSGGSSEAFIHVEVA